MSRSILGSLILFCLVELKLLVVKINVWVKTYGETTELPRISVPFGDVWWHRLIYIILVRLGSLPKSSHPNPTTCILYEVMPIIGSLGSLGSKESPGDDLSARQRECEDAPRRAAKELRWQAWSTAFRWQRRIPCIGSSSMYACYLRIGMKKHTLHGFLWFVHVVKRCLDLTKCWRNASFIEPTAELITSAKWYAPTSNTGSTAMGDLTIFDDLQTNFPAMTSFVSLFVHYFWTSALWGSAHIYPFRSFKTWLSWVRQCLSATHHYNGPWFSISRPALSPPQCWSLFVHGRRQKDAASAGPEKERHLAILLQFQKATSTPWIFRCKLSTL